MFVKLFHTHRCSYAFLVESYRQSDRRYPLQRYLMNLGKMGRAEAEALRDLISQCRRLKEMETVLADYREEGATGIRYYPHPFHFQRRFQVRKGVRRIGFDRR
jgi:hypothetical protein